MELDFSFWAVMGLCVINLAIGIIDITKKTCVYVPKLAYKEDSIAKFSTTSGLIEILLSVGIAVMTFGSKGMLGGQMAVYAGGGLTVLMLVSYIMFKNKTLVRR